MTKNPRRRALRFASVALVAAGVAVSGWAVYGLTLGENEAAVEQQKAAEVEPLVEPLALAETGVRYFQVGEVFAKLRAPRLGDTYVRNIAQGTSIDKVLNTVGIGHYVSSQMPSEVGNFALAGHRAGNGGPFRNIDKFVAGDQVFIETAEGVYTYQYLDQAIVAPDAIGVIAKEPVGLELPEETGPESGDLKTNAGGKYLTLTTCTPIYVNTDRLVVWFELVDFASAGSSDSDGTDSGQ